MLALLGLSIVVIAGPVQGPCYVLYDAAGARIYQDYQPPFSRELPPSREAEASRRRGERLVVYPDFTCDRDAAAVAPPAPPAAPAPPVASGAEAAAPPRFPAIEARVADGQLAIAPARTVADPNAKAAYDPFKTGQVAGGFLAGIERVRRGLAERGARGLSFVDTATLAATEGQEAMHRAAMEIARHGGERAYDTAYNCYLGNDPENCIGGNRTGGVLDLAMRPGTRPSERERADRAMAAMDILSRGGAYAGGTGNFQQGGSAGGAASVLGSPLERAEAELLRRASWGDQEALKLWLMARNPVPTPAKDGPQTRAAPPPAKPTVSFDEAEKLATEEERRRQDWWLFQWPLDRRRITERTLEILEQSARGPSPYGSPAEVFDAYRSGLISREEALRDLDALRGR